MELEGFGASLIGRNLWIVGSQIPWEYIQGTHYTARILIRGSKPTLAEAEGEWNSIWCSPQAKDWSYIATILRGVGLANCLLVMDHVDPPKHFGSIWIPWYVAFKQKCGFTKKHPCLFRMPFFPPLRGSLPDIAYQVFHALPPRNGHGAWTTSSWDSIVAATAAQDLGVVVSDVEETTWTLMWHRPEDSRLPKEKSAPLAKHWIQLGIELL